tara:strand:+ start:152 stop:451 length:300 start_codon:yes stop_codon:yes gene_type:complete
MAALPSPSAILSTGNILWKQILSRLVTRINAIHHKRSNRKTNNKEGSNDGRIWSPEHEQKNRVIRENRRRNRMQGNSKEKERTPRPKIIDQRNNRDTNI